MRYKLRSGSKNRPPADDPSLASPEPLDALACTSAEGVGDGCTPSKRARRSSLRRRKVRKVHQSEDAAAASGGAEADSAAAAAARSRCCLTDLPNELVLHLLSFLDTKSMLVLLRTNHWFYDQLSESSAYWRMLCRREEFVNYPCLQEEEQDQHQHQPEADSAESAEKRQRLRQEKQQRLGMRNKPLRCTPPEHYTVWRRVFLRGLQMRRNICQGNFEGWRIYANTNVPAVKLTPELDLNQVKRRMGDFPRLSENDDLKIDWDDKHLAVFHFFRGTNESCVIRLWDIENEPRFLYSVEKNVEFITDKISVVQDYIVIVPSWPLEAMAMVMTLDLRNRMEVVGKYIFSDVERQTALDEKWEHTQLRVIRNEAMVVCRCPDWTLVVVDLPQCRPLYEVKLGDVSDAFDATQLRSYKQTAMILFSRKQSDNDNASASNANILVTVGVKGAETRVRSSYACSHVVDVALFTDPEEIYIMKSNGDVLLFDADGKTEMIKIANQEEPMDYVPIAPVNYGSAGGGGDNAAGDAAPAVAGAAAAGAQAVAVAGGGGSGSLSEYQLFVNRKEQICVMQSSSEVAQGRHIKVYTYSQRRMYTINLDLCQFGLSRDESICIYTNGAFLAASDSKQFALFNVKTGKYLGYLQIPPHLERTKGKEEKDCMFEQTGLSMFIFDEDRLIAMHDYERSFPAVLDIYKFW